jgi:uncharacterized delta-60 repeat protein
MGVNWWRMLGKQKARASGKARRVETSRKFKPDIELLEKRELLSNTAGMLDPSFGGNPVAGLDLTNLFYDGMNKNSTAIQADGKIVVAGVSAAANPGMFAVARFDTLGNLDPTFGPNHNGLVLTQFVPGVSVDAARDIAVQTDGKIVVAGTTNAGGGNSQDNFGVIRYLPDGSVDTANFGVGGKALVDFYGGDDQLRAMAIQADGRIVLAGLTTPVGDPHQKFAIARMNSDGTQDSDFDADGKITFDFASQYTGGLLFDSTDGLNDVAIQPDGKIVVAGFTTTSPDLKTAQGPLNFALARFNGIDGTLDASFGKSGLVDTDFLGADNGNTVVDGNDLANQVVITPSGRIFAAGWTEQGGGGQNFGLVAYSPNGQVDKTFNADGLVETDFSTNFTSGSLGLPPVNDQANSMILQPDGKIVMSGLTNRNGTNSFGLARYNVDGTLDQGFGTHGEVVTAFGAGSDDTANNLLIQPDGKLVLAGFSNGSFALARYFGYLPGSFQFASATASVLQDGGSLILTVNRVGGTDGPATVQFATSDGTAIAGTDYVTTTGVLSFAPGQSTQSITIPILNSAVAGPDRTFTVTLNNATGGATLGATPSITVTVINDANLPKISVSDASVEEPTSGTVGITFTVTLSASSSQTITVIAGTADNTAVAGTDYVALAPPTLVTFNPGITSQTVTVQVYGDTNVEPDRTFFLNLTSPGHAVIARAQGIGAILADHGANTGRVQFSAASYTVSESGGLATITVLRVGGSTGTIQVNYATSDGTGVAGKDYAPAAGNLIFNDGETSKTFTVSIVDNKVHDSDKTVNLTLTNPASGGARLGTQSTAVLTILNDVPLPFFKIDDVTVQQLNVATNTAVFTVTLSAPTAMPVTVDFSTADGTATAPTRYQAVNGTLQFNPGDVSKTITVLIPPSTVVGSNLNFFVNLTNPTNAVIEHGQAQGIIINNNQADVIQFAAASYLANASDFTGQISLSRSGGLASGVTVTLVPTAGTAVPGIDFNPAPILVTFTGGQTTATVAVPLLDAALIESSRTVNLALVTPTGSATLGAPSTAVLTIRAHGGTPNQRYVAQVYRDILGREADTTGLNYFASALDNGTVSRQTLANMLVGSPEYRSIEVQNTYNQILGRTADPGALTFFSNFLASGGTLVQLRGILLSSDEFFQKNQSGPNQGNEGYVNAVFQHALGRPVDLITQAYFVFQLTTGKMSRAQFANIVASSQEAAAFRVQTDFQTYLHRSADSGATGFFGNLLLTGGLSEEGLIAFIVGSSEYYADTTN